MSELISPAPTTSTRRPCRRPKIFRASATAAKLTDTAPSPSAVSVRTRLPTPNDQLEDVAEHRPDTPLVGGRLERVLHLAENLRLADHERIEPCRHAKQVRDRGAVFQREQVRLKGLRRHVVVVTRGTCTSSSRAAAGSAARHVNLRAVAGREHHRLGHRRTGGNRFHRGTEVAAGEIKTLPQIDGRRAVAHA